MKTQRNYSIEFYRFTFAVNFTIVHALFVFPVAYMRSAPLFMPALDIILPFMIFAGYFMMQGFEKQQRLGYGSLESAPRQAWNHLKTRLVALLPVFLLAQLMGFVAKNIWLGTPLIEWPVRLINGIYELVGLQITGLGFGSATAGAWGEGIRVHQLMNAPMWFISGIFICGYIIYFLLAANKKLFIGLIAPLSFILYYSSEFLLQTSYSPMMWFDIRSYGDMRMAAGFPHMFVGLSLGCLIYVAVNNLKGKKWSRGTIAFMTVAQIILTFIVLLRTWVPTSNSISQFFNMGWETTHMLSIFFCFLILLNVDKCTRFRLTNAKIWGTPGRMAFYVYMLHFPIMVFCAQIMGITRGTELIASNAYMLTGVTIVSSIIISYIVMKIDVKVVSPWLKNKPWYNKEQKQIEKELEAAAAQKAKELATSAH